MALTAAEKLVASSEFTLDAAKAALIPFEEAFNGAEGLVTAAEVTLEGVETTFAAGLDAAAAIASYGLNGLVRIREISFDVSLDAAAGGAFSGSVRAEFAGSAEVTISLSIDLRDITSMARQLADHIGNGLSSLF